MRRAMTVVAAGAAVVVAAMLAGSGPATAVPGGPRHGQVDGLRTRGEFAPPDASVVTRAVTYDVGLVPEGARISVRQRVRDGAMWVEVVVDGVSPGHTFGTHVHTDPCGSDPQASGGHYQDQPGDEPWRANPENEVWLDLTADAAGVGRAAASQEWVFREGEARSVVLHEHTTSSGDGHGVPGDAGDRVACLTVPFIGLDTVSMSEGE